MLSIATLGMFSYGTYSIVWALVDVVRGARLELWADVALVLFGALLVVSAAFVRVRLPGGLALAIGAMLGLQALAVQSALQLGSGLAPQIGRGLLGLLLVGLTLGDGDNRRVDGGPSADPPVKG